MPEMIFLNGKIISKEAARVAVLEPGFLYGWGLFETMRSYSNRIAYFNQHLERLKNSCSLIDVKLPYSTAELKQIIKEIIKLSCLRDVYIRLTLWKTSSGTDVLIVARRYRPYSRRKYRRGFRVCVCRFRQNENSPLAHLKTTNYLLYQLAYVEAKDKRFDEAIILNNRGYIAECSRSNILLVKNKTIFTPDLECGCLDGITRQVVFYLAKKHNLKIYEGKFTLHDLYEADEAFLTNSLMGIMPLRSIEKHLVGRGVDRFRLTQFFMKEYAHLFREL